MGISNPDTMAPSGLEATTRLLPSFSRTKDRSTVTGGDISWDISITPLPRIPLATTIFGLTVTDIFRSNFAPFGICCADLAFGCVSVRSRMVEPSDWTTAGLATSTMGFGSGQSNMTIDAAVTTESAATTVQ
jgi:hypothetical protein